MMTIKSFELTCGCQYEQKGIADSERGTADVLYKHIACEQHKPPLSFGAAARGAEPEGIRAPRVGDVVPAHLREGIKPVDVFAGDNDRGITGLRLADGSIAPAKRKLCVQCGQETLPDGTCYHGNTPVGYSPSFVPSRHTACDLTIAEREFLARMILIERAEMRAEKKTLQAVSKTRGDGSWEGRIKEIDAREEILKTIAGKVQP